MAKRDCRCAGTLGRVEALPLLKSRHPFLTYSRHESCPPRSGASGRRRCLNAGQCVRSTEGISTRHFAVATISGIESEAMRDSEQPSKMKALLSSELKKQGRPFGEFVPAADSVPVDRIQPYLRQLTKLRPIKRGFEVIGEEPKLSETPTEGASRQQRKQMREERRKRRQTDVKASP